MVIQKAHENLKKKSVFEYIPNKCYTLDILQTGYMYIFAKAVEGLGTMK